MKQDVLENAISLAKAGFTVFKIIGKRPAVKWRNNPYTLPFEIDNYFKGWGHNYGIAPTKNQLIIDIDPRNFLKNDRPHIRLFKSLNIDLKIYKTPIVKTGGGGFHIYFNIKNIPDNMKIKKNNPEFKGIDFISDGAYVVGPGSIHPDTQKKYTLVNNFDVIQNAPEKLINLLLREKIPKVFDKLDDIKSSKDSDKSIVDKYKVFLETISPAEEGDNGDLQTYKVACAGRDFSLSSQKTLDMMVEFYNPRCSPPWDIEELQIKIKNAYEYASGDQGSKLAENDFNAIEKDEFVRWDRTEQDYKQTLNNTINFFKPLQRFGFNQNKLVDVLIFNDFSGQRTKIKWMPWDKSQGKKMPKGGYEWTDDDSVELKAYLSIKRKFEVSKATLEDAITTVARMKAFHPVRDYLNSITWDKKSRLENWLIQNSGAKDNPLNREISRITIMQAVARIFYPGCQCDNVTVLEGNQGIRKTTLVRILGGEWYAAIIIDPNNKDTADAMRGKWFIEMEEMEVTRKTDAQKLKAFITRVTDRYRPAYGRRPIDIPRQSNFIGTFNPDNLGQYINDPTGGRRFSPISLGHEMINTDEIKKIRDQLFAEATERILLGEPWHITNPEVLKQLEKEQRKRQMEDGWLPLVEDFAKKQTEKYIRGIDVFTDAIHGVVTQYKFHEQRRIANCLKDCGFLKATYRFKGKPVSGFLNPRYHPTIRTEDLYE